MGHLKEAVVLQVIVHVREQQFEYQASPELAQVVDGCLAVLASTMPPSVLKRKGIDRSV